MAPSVPLTVYSAKIWCVVRPLPPHPPPLIEEDRNALSARSLCSSRLCSPWAQRVTLALREVGESPRRRTRSCLPLASSPLQRLTFSAQRVSANADICALIQAPTPTTRSSTSRSTSRTSPPTTPSASTPLRKSLSSLSARRARLGRSISPSRASCSSLSRSSGQRAD